MKKLFICAMCALVATTCFSQSKQSIKYYSETAYTTECKNGVMFAIWDHVPTYWDFQANIKKWAYPHKVIHWQVNKFRLATKAQLKLKGNKFKCDDWLSIGKFSIQVMHSYSWWANNKPIMTIDSRDSDKTFTVYFDRGSVKFINDSVFTFKMTK